ncbi:spinster family MFS transporter [Azospirillum griseum]|uniref:MFS transporter n=1 Tax=Azospirillum griseum TaxID=2496639 RepID=A0A3S0K0L7_9PROT|nr:MFS transporter [Azospirillum griseum]RTR14621.1 MFS transporter [Azospirillum griseum]
MSNAADTAAPPLADTTIRPDVSAARANYVLALLAVVWAINFFDRNILNALLEPIKRDLGVSDTMLGFMSGFGFVILHVAMSVPIARLADRIGRVPVISTGLAVWSLMTALSGFATSATQLLIARSVVGIAEASNGGPTQALLSDYFPAERRAQAMSVLSIATFVGIFLAFALGGYVNQHYGWQTAFFVAGVPGLLVAVVVRLTVRDRMAARPTTNGTETDLPSFGETLRFLAAQRTYVLVAIALCFAAFCNAVIVSWSSALLQRVHHLSTAEAGMIIGPIMGLSGIGGGLAGAVILNRLCRRDIRWMVWAPCLAFLVSIPAMVAFCLSNDRSVTYAALVLTAVFAGFAIGPTAAAVQSTAKTRMRALGGAIALALSNLFGWGLGPLVVGVLNDALHPTFGDQAIRYAMLVGAVSMIGGAVIYSLAARSIRADVAACAD